MDGSSCSNVPPLKWGIRWDGYTSSEGEGPKIGETAGSDDEGSDEEDDGMSMVLSGLGI